MTKSNHHLPSFTARFVFDHPNRGLDISEGIFETAQASLSLSHKNMEGILEILSRNNKHAIVLGSPIIDDTVDRRKVAEALINTNNPAKIIQSINGEFLFLLYDDSEKVLRIATDRYSSYPLFFAKNNQEFCFSYNYIDLARHCLNWTGFKLRPEKAYEFFMMQRLIGEDTHDTLTKSLSPARILTIHSDGSLRQEIYWQQKYKKNNTIGKKKLLGQFVDMFSHSVAVRSNSDNVGIFLSGGHDSRLVAAYTDPGATCYTLSFSDNLEVKRAKQIAEAAKHNHVFCELAPDFFEKTLEKSAYLSGGLYATDHALFLSDGIKPKPDNQVYLHGHGLDFMYQGMYLHAKTYQLFGRDTYIKRFVSLPENLTEHFIKKIPFRSRFPMERFFNQESVKHKEKLYFTVKAIEDKAKTLSDDPMDQWEYMVFHNPSRHYTFSNVLSKRSCGELRTPSFDNALYDFYLSLPLKYRLHGEILRGALYKKNRHIARLPAANHGLPAAWGPYQKTAATIFRKLLRHATFNKFFVPPQGKDRTWPDRDSYFNEHPAYYNMAMQALNDQEFKGFLNFIDWQKLEDNKKDLLNEKFGGVFLIALLSYYSFYRALKQ